MHYSRWLRHGSPTVKLKPGPSKKNGPCEFPDCLRPIEAKRLCSKHYRRLQRRGDANIVLSAGGKPIPVSGRFWSKVKKIRGGCWIWTGGVNNKGYGSISYNGKGITTHALRLKLKGIKIPKGYEIDHVCKNRRCVRYHPRHLRVIPIKENRGQANRSKTHCSRGHAYDEANTYVTTSGARACRACRREYFRNYKRKK